jgi:hypothetical protein
MERNEGLAGVHLKAAERDFSPLGQNLPFSNLLMVHCTMAAASND